MKKSKTKFNIYHEPSQIALRRVLEETHLNLLQTDAIFNDAQAPARRYKDTRDLEFAAFICAIIAYGRISHIKVSIARILDRFGDRPVERLLAMTDDELKFACRGWLHRFNSENDILRMLQILKVVYGDAGSIQNLIADFELETAGEALEVLIEMLIAQAPEPIGPRDSFWFFLPRPSVGSACKRLNLFLRWMIGKSESDFGLWTCLTPAQLIIPVDTHVLNQSLILGLTDRKNGDWKTAEEITAALRLLDANDPTRFDFALCHIGIRGLNILELMSEPAVFSSVSLKRSL